MNLRRLAVEFTGCNDKIRDDHSLMNALGAGIAVSGATLLSTARADYTPHGLTLVCFLAESHVILTTWPEHSLVVLDVLACGDIKLEFIEEALQRCLSPAYIHRTDANYSVPLETKKTEDARSISPQSA